MHKERNINNDTLFLIELMYAIPFKTIPMQKKLA